MVSCTPTRYIAAVALRPSLDASEDLVETIIDEELADLKMLILANRRRHLEDEAKREREDEDHQDAD